MAIADTAILDQAGITRALTPAGARQAAALQHLPDSLVLLLRIIKPDGRVVIPVDVRPGMDAISLTEVEPGDFVMLRVTDTGTGIPERVKPQIFDPFFTSKPAGEGTGLGLAITKHIIDYHYGTIAVDSEPGKGATFIFTLPASDSAR